MQLDKIKKIIEDLIIHEDTGTNTEEVCKQVLDLIELQRNEIKEISQSIRSQIELERNGDMFNSEYIEFLIDKYKL